MISSASWDKSTRVNYSEANQIARPRSASLICSLKNLPSQIAREKSYEC